MVSQEELKNKFEKMITDNEFSVTESKRNSEWIKIQFLLGDYGKLACLIEGVKRAAKKCGFNVLEIVKHMNGEDLGFVEIAIEPL
ncbi:MAG: hypothetical protein KAR08_05910 [Candidatus Heimdallarchaeota archaeon]|nr:hypothetical protein [Candidatus Heimdallarchaeota archaeon]